MRSSCLHTRRGRLAAIIATASMFTSGLALPAPAVAAVTKAIRKQARRMSNQAAAHFHARRYKQAAELFEQAYALDPAKLIRLRNAGRAYEEAGMAEPALHCFKRFRDRTADARLRVDAQERIARLEKQLAPKPAPKAAVADKATSAAKQAVTTVAAPSRGSTTLSWWMIGSGGAALAAGGTLLVMALSARNKVEDGWKKELYSAEALYHRDLDTVTTNERIAYAGLAAGAVGVGVGIWLRTRAHKPARAALLPIPLGGRPGMVALLRF